MNQPVIVLVQTKYLPYYNNHSSQHYIVVDGLTKYIEDYSNSPAKSISTVRIVDPNNNSTYTGYHTVLFNELYRAAIGYFETGEQYYNLNLNTNFIKVQISINGIKYGGIF